MPFGVGFNVKIKKPIEIRKAIPGLTFFRQFTAARLPEGVKSISMKREIPAVMNIAFADVWMGNLTTERKEKSLAKGKLTTTSSPWAPLTVTRDIFQGLLCGIEMTSNSIPMSSKHDLLIKIHKFRMKLISNLFHNRRPKPPPKPVHV